MHPHRTFRSIAKTIPLTLCLTLLIGSALGNEKQNTEGKNPYSFEIKPDRIIDGTYETIAENGRKITSKRKKKTWQLKQDITGYPKYSSPNSPLLEAVYNLSIEETKKNTRPLRGSKTPVLNTGTTWNKVWTRDTAFSVQYSLAWITPIPSRDSLLEKIQGDPAELVEDTGTGGSYPVSTDRVIMAIAVWEYYLATGDKNFLSKMYDIMKYTAEKDLHVVRDPHTGLYRGETSGLDHRRKTYPVWMDQGHYADIAQSKAASTNVFYAVLFKILAQTSDILGKKEAGRWQKLHDDVKKAINQHLWQPSINAYASWQYPGYMGNPVPEKIDVIANGYAIYYGIADQEKALKITENYPMIKYGANTVYPQKPDGVSIYHNWGIWPGWEGCLMLGASKIRQYAVVDEIFKSNLYNVAMSLSNYEVVNYKTGEGIASTQQLWSIASTLACYYRILFGMEYTPEGIRFAPHIPEFAKGPLNLTDYKYKNSTLDITVTGSGSGIAKMTVNGKTIADPSQFILQADGNKHTIAIEMDGKTPATVINLKEANLVVCPPIPAMHHDGNRLTWKPLDEHTYKLWTGTEYIDVTGKTEYTPPKDKYGAYSLIAITKNGIHSEYSSPIIINPAGTVVEIEMEDKKACRTSLPVEKNIKGYSGEGYLADRIKKSTDSRPSATTTVEIPQTGMYAVSYIYNNGGYGKDGIYSGSHCGIRSLLVNGKDAGTIIFSVTHDHNFYPSTRLIIPLSKGKHNLTLGYNIGERNSRNTYDINMSPDVNNIYLDKIKLELISPEQQKN